MLMHSRLNRFGLLILLALLLVLLVFRLTSDLAAAQGPVTPAHVDPYWQAAYWDNINLSGVPILERAESTLEHNWDTASPDARVPADYFSARWLRYIDVAPGVYRFTATSDDGIRVFVDDQLIIDQWTIHAEQTSTGDIQLAEAHHLLRVEYFEYDGLAVAKLRWQSIPEVTSGAWRGEYYDNRALEGAPAFIRYDDEIDFTWSGSPRNGEIDGDNFSVRWTHRPYFAEGSYRFRITVDDGARLYVNHHLLIDKWFDQSSTSYMGEIYLPSGNIPIDLAYYEHEGVARIRLTWERIDADHPSWDGEWRGEYFNNESLAGNPVLVRFDRRIKFDWGSGSPASSVDRNHFSVRWTRSIDFDGGYYRFTTETDDGVRLYIDGELVIDQWRDMARTEYSAKRNLNCGYHTIRMEYFEGIGDAYARLTWEFVDEEEREKTTPVGNIITCVPPQPANCAWVKVYRLDPSGSWIDISESGFASWAASGYLKIDGLLVDINTYGEAGHPYRVEQWVDGQRIYSIGNFQASEPTFLVRPYVDNYTPWQCQP